MSVELAGIVAARTPAELRAEILDLRAEWATLEDEATREQCAYVNAQFLVLEQVAERMAA